ncbi:MAG: hypothetical protein H0U53_08265 [Actinobacteria bacterium]|nr:hypothetical protein [Actinomycetota bacterium]
MGFALEIDQVQLAAGDCTTDHPVTHSCDWKHPGKCRNEGLAVGVPNPQVLLVLKDKSLGESCQWPSLIGRRNIPRGHGAINCDFTQRLEAAYGPITRDTRAVIVLVDFEEGTASVVPGAISANPFGYPRVAWNGDGDWLFIGPANAYENSADLLAFQPGESTAYRVPVVIDTVYHGMAAD